MRRSLFQQHCFLAGFRYAELHHSLGRNADGLSGLRVATQTLFAVDEDQLSNTGKRERVLGFPVCELGLFLKKRDHVLLLHVELTGKMGDDRSLRHCLSH